MKKKTLDNSVFRQSGAAQAAPDKLKEIRKQAIEMADLQNEVDGLEQLLKEKNGTLHKMKTETLPELLTSAGIMSFTLDDGTKIQVEDFVSGSLPKDVDKRTAALKYLRTLPGGDALIRTEVVTVFGKGEDKEAAKVVATLNKQGLKVDVSSGVNHMTLQAFGRELLRDGKKVDVSKLGLFAGKTTKVVTK